MEAVGGLPSSIALRRDETKPIADSGAGVAGWVDRRHRPSITAFHPECKRPQHPVVRNGCLGEWAGRRRWCDVAFQRYADVALKASGRSADRRRYRMSAGDYLCCATAVRRKRPVHVFGNRVLERPCSALLDDFGVPPYFSADFFALLSGASSGRIIAGSSRQGGVECRMGWMQAVTFYPATVVPPGGSEELIHSVYYASQPYLQWYREQHRPKNTAAATAAVPSLPAAPPLVALVFPGDLLFIPSGWRHQVLNIGHIAAGTQNFCPRYNFAQIGNDRNAHADRSALIDFQQALRRAGHDAEAGQIDITERRRRKCKMKE